MVSEPIAVTLRVIQVLDQLGIPYFIGGSLASTLYGEPRTTVDADLVADMRADQAIPFANSLAAEFYADAEMIREAIRNRSSFNLIHYATGFKVDVFIRKTRPFDDAQFVRRQLRVIAGDPEIRAFMASAEDSILAKLEWYRIGGEMSDRQWRDVLGMLKAQQARLDSEYMKRTAEQMGLAELLRRAIEQAG